MTRIREQEELRLAVRANSRWALALLTAFVVQASCFLTYAYVEYRRAVRPKNMVDLAEARLKAHYPELRAALKNEVIRNAPRIAEKLSDEAVASAPEARKRLEHYLDRQLDEGFGRVTDLSAEQFRELLRDNRGLVLRGYRELEALPQEVEQFTLDLENQIDRKLGTDLRKQARFALSIHHAMNEKLERLERGYDLEPHELLERRIVRILRTIQLQEFPTETTRADREPVPERARS